MGIPFPDIYDWTFGEIIDYINSKNELEREQSKVKAQLLFRTASLVARMVNNTSRGREFKITQEYKFLWTQEELDELRRDELRRKLKVKNT